PHLKEQWVIPPKANSAFVAAMEDVLEVYHRPHDPDYPLVCVDAEDTVARLQTELSTALEAKVEAELAAQKARTYADIARNELELAINDANAAKEEAVTLKASDGTSASYIVNRIIFISISTTALLLLIVWTLFRMLGISPRPPRKADTSLGVPKEPRLPT